LRESMHSVLAGLPASFRLKREQLLELLLRDAILHRSELQPVVSRDGSSARWMLDSLAITLKNPGAELAADCLLGLLQSFEGRQLATFGITAIPLLQSVLLRSRRRYSGLLVRKELKPHGSLRRIEGQIRPDEPVILIDDSISSGLSMQDACRYLEQAGLRVEGGVVLVRFGWEHGYSSMQKHGYHLECVYDVWDDLMPGIPGEPHLLRNPTKDFGDPPWAEKQARNGLHPTALARDALVELFRNGRLLRPPDTMDAEYDSSGGAWISLRDRDDIYLRYARDGFWHFPWEKPWSACEDVVRAAWLTARELKGGSEAMELLGRSALAVTFFGELKESDLGGLDNDRYGIVVCSKERRAVMGGALPAMPGIGGEWAQFWHAAYKNAGLHEHEPYVIYRHEVSKVVEPGACWHKSGVAVPARISSFHDPCVCAPLATRARELAIAEIFGTAASALPDNLLPADLDSLYVTVYFDGKLRGCAGSETQSLDCDLQELVAAACEDERFSSVETPADPEFVAVTVSLLSNRLVLGEMAVEEVSVRFRLADQALAVRQNDRWGMLLPFFAVRHNLDRIGLASAVIEKAGLTEPPFEWIRYDCATWLADDRGCDLLLHAFRDPAPNIPAVDSVRLLIDWHCGYLIRSQAEDGSFYFVYDPIGNYRCRGGGLPRSAHATWTLMRAARLLDRPDLRAAGDKALAFHLDLLRREGPEIWLCATDEPPSVSELAFCLLALHELPSNDSRRDISSSIASTLWSRIDANGRVATHRGDANTPDEYQDYFPGQALLALAVAHAQQTTPCDAAKLERALRFYRHRFRHKRDFGQVSWLMQAGRRWWEATRHAAWRDLVFEIGDWISKFQLSKSGGFITSHQTDGPGYTTALYLEGLSAAAHLARQSGDERRCTKYLSRCDKGFAFLQSLVFRPEHKSILPNGVYAAGGMRASLTSSEIRTDFVQHSLAAALESFSMLERGHPAGQIYKLENTHERS
jgi:orotate phosphoribosyltransferase/AMMECR1 domain-containing protein